MADDTIKRDWIVCGDLTDVEWDEKLGGPRVFTTEKAALSHAKVIVQTTENLEAWIYGLTHVVSRPTADPVVDVVK